LTRGRATGVRVFVVDDSPTARRMLSLLLTELRGVVVIGEASSGEECLARVDELAPDVIVMDWKMRGIDGARTTEDLLARHPDVRVVGFTSSGSTATHRAFLDAGAAAVFAKHDAMKLRDYLGDLCHAD
jgi:DNA-binding NarL/FixJ family response regulator